MKHGYLVVVAALLAACAGDLGSQYDRSMELGDFAQAKILMRRQIEEYSYRDFNPTLPTRLGNSYIRLAYAHGMLGEYDSMKIALFSSLSHDPGLVDRQDEMLEYFATLEYNKAIAAYDTGDYAGARNGLETALKIIGSEQAHAECAGTILRAMAFATSALGDVKGAAEYCERAAGLGDSEAEKVLAEYRKEGLLKAPERLERRKNVPLNL